jgi:hypothetical protein
LMWTFSATPTHPPRGAVHEGGRSMFYIQEQLVRDHIRQLYEEAEAARRVPQVPRAGQPSRAGRILRRVSQLTHRRTQVRSVPAHTLDTTTSSA